MLWTVRAFAHILFFHQRIGDWAAGVVALQQAKLDLSSLKEAASAFNDILHAHVDGVARAGGC